MDYPIKAGETILHHMEYNSIVEFRLIKARKFLRIEEQSDACFNVEYNKAQIKQLIEELQALHANMVD